MSPEGIFVLTPFKVTVASPAVPFPFFTTSIIEGSVILGLVFMISRLTAATSSSVNSLIFFTGVFVVGATIAVLAVVSPANNPSSLPRCPARCIVAYTASIALSNSLRSLSESLLVDESELNMSRALAICFSAVATAALISAFLDSSFTDFSANAVAVWLITFASEIVFSNSSFSDLFSFLSDLASFLSSDFLSSTFLSSTFLASKDLLRKLIEFSNATVCASTCAWVAFSSTIRSLALLSSIAASTVNFCWVSDRSFPARVTNKSFKRLTFSCSFILTALVLTTVLSAVFSATSAFGVSTFSVDLSLAVVSTGVSCLVVSAAWAAPPRNKKPEAINTEAVPALNFLIPYWLIFSDCFVLFIFVLFLPNITFSF